MSLNNEQIVSKETLLPAPIQSPESLAQLSNEELDSSIKEHVGGAFNALSKLKRCKPLVEEMRRRFKNLKGMRPHADGSPQMIAGCQTFEAYCNNVLSRSKQAVYLMLREEKPKNPKPAKILVKQEREAKKMAAEEDKKVPYCEMTKRAADSIRFALEKPQLVALRDERAMAEVDDISALEDLIATYQTAANFLLDQIAPCKARIAFLRELAVEKRAAENSMEEEVVNA